MIKKSIGDSRVCRKRDPWLVRVRQALSDLWRLVQEPVVDGIPVSQRVVIVVS
jgi:hypothetical protein